MSTAKGNDSVTATDSNSDGSPSRTRLSVPPPDFPWTGAKLARALHTDTAQSKADKGDANGKNNNNTQADAGGATTTIFSFPFSLPVGTGGTGVPQLPSLTSLLSRPRSSSTAMGQQSGNEESNFSGYGTGRVPREHGSLDAPSSTVTTTTTDEAGIPSQPLSLGVFSRSSLPTLSVSGVTQIGATTADVLAAAGSQGHSLSSVSSDTTVATEVQDTDLSPQTPPHVAALDEASQVHSLMQQSNSQAPSSFTDLFVGLVRPRLHRLPRQNDGGTPDVWHLAGAAGVDAGASPQSSAVGSTTSHNLLSLVHAGTNSETSTQDDVAEDEAGAHTPTVYRSPQLPHWWRSIVTPSVGTRVCLRPNTARLEFWWIDRLGSEAYELLQVILKHSLEGIVTRESGEAVVVVEFIIPAEHLGNTSLAVWHPHEGFGASQRAPASTSAAPAPAEAAETSDLWNVDGNFEDAETTIEGTACTVAPPLRPDERDSANTNTTDSHLTTPIYHGLPHAIENSAATGASSTFTIGRHTERTETHSTNTSEMFPHLSDAFSGLPELVRAGSVHHDSAEQDNNNLTFTTSGAAAMTNTIIDIQKTSTMTGARVSSPAAPRPRPRAASAAVRRSGSSSDGVFHRDETSVPSLHYNRSAAVLRRRSSSADARAGSGYSSRSTVDHSTSVVTAGGGQSDPFVVERRFCQEPPLTRVLTTSPALRRMPVVVGAEGSVHGRVPSRPFPTGTQRAEPAGNGPANHSLRSPMTPGERGYSPDASADNMNDTSVVDSRDTVTGEGSERSGSPPFDGPQRLRKLGASPPYELPTTVCVGSSATQTTQLDPSQQQSELKNAHKRASLTDRTGNMKTPNSSNRGFADDPQRQSSPFDEEDPSLMHVEPLPKSDDVSANQSGIEMTHQSNLPHTWSCYDPFPKSKTYGEWLRTNSTQSRHSPTSPLEPSVAGKRYQGGGGGSVVNVVGSGLVAASPPWSHEDPNETTNFLGKTTSVRDTDNSDAHRDDSILVRLSLPTSVCIPVVAVRLQALRLLHPLLHALTIPFSLPLFNSDNAEDDDGIDGALLTAAHVSPFTSELTGQTLTPDYTAAVQILSDAIHRAEVGCPTSTAAPSAALSTDPSAVDATVHPAGTLPPETRVAPPPPPMLPRDLSILYTIRSHLYFHMSPEYLYDSLKDAERALSSCPTQEHVSSTYEVLTACLISFGHTAQVDRVSAHLRHRFRTPSPLITRLGRVTQVMVSYGTLFLHQQLSPALLRSCDTSSAPERLHKLRPLLLADGVQSTPIDGCAYLTPATNPTSRTAAAAAAAFNGAGSQRSGGSAAFANSFASATAMPLVVVGGGIVDPPVDWGRQPSPPHLAGSLTMAATSTAVTPRTLPYEVCPLLLGYYGKSLHRANESTHPPYPPPLSRRAGGAAATVGTAKGEGPGGQQQPSRHLSRPSNDVCHRRLFLLETLFPSVMPQTVGSRLQAVPVTIPRAGVYRGSLASRSPRGTRRHGQTGDGESDGSEAAAAARNEKRIKPEDFMYDRDSMFALLANTTETTIPFGTVPMRHFCRHIRLSATRRIQRGETVLLERPALLLAMWPLLPPVRAARSGRSDSTLPFLPRSGGDGGCRGSECGSIRSAAASGRDTAAFPQRKTPAYCAQCGRQRLTCLVHCPGKCGSTYCSEACRREALRLYHVVECGGLTEAFLVDASTDTVNVDDDARVRRTVASLQTILAEWTAFLYDFANWDTTSTRSTTPTASRSPSVSAPSPFPEPKPDGTYRPQEPPQKQRSPPPILAVTALRAMTRLVAMMLCVVLPIEILPQLRKDNEAFVTAWAKEREAVVRAVARTLRYRGLMVPAAMRGGSTNLYCTGVDPHSLLLLEVILQQLSVPFFADFTYASPSTVWEAIKEFPSAVARKATPARGNGGGKSINVNADTPTSGAARTPCLPFSPRTSKSKLKPTQAPGQREWFVELSYVQREEVMSAAHRVLKRVHDAVCAELRDVFVLPCRADAARNGDDSDDATAGAPLQWTCPELVGFLSSTRVFEELLDFCLASCAVVYPQEVEPDVAAGVSNSGSTSPAPHGAKISDGVPAVPLAVISPWTCLTVDLHPFLGHGTGGVIYSRFMVEHEQRRRMIAYCAAAAGRCGGANLGASGYGSGLEDDSFLSIHSMASASTAAVLSGSLMSPGTDDSGKSSSLRDDWNLQMLEEAANRSCANLRLSLVHSLPSRDASRPPTVAVVMTAKKNIQLGDVLWWESQNFGEYLHPFF